MKRFIYLCIFIFVISYQVYGMSSLYTNAMEGATVSLFEDISLTNSVTDDQSSMVAGIVFPDNQGGGELAGPGDLSVYNIGTGNNAGAGYFAGILASSLVVTSYTGTISVENDRSSFTNVSSSEFAVTMGICATVQGNVTNQIFVSSVGGIATPTGSDQSISSIGIFPVMNRIAVEGDLAGEIRVEATGGFSDIADPTVSADANAAGVIGLIYGDITGRIESTATGGSSLGDATAEARGIYGGLTGDMTGYIGVSANGGSGIMDTSAKAMGIGNDVVGNVSGEIIGFAKGGTSEKTDALARGIAGSLYGDLSGEILMIAMTGRATASSNGTASACASAYGVQGDIIAGDVTGSIMVGVLSTGATAESNAVAGADAYGIYGNTVQVSNFTGRIVASAFSGTVITNGVSSSGRATAIAIYARDSLYLNATGGEIQAEVLALNGFDLSSDSKALALCGGQLEDVVRLSGIYIMGDVDLNGGTNRLEILGDTRMEGDIYATGGLNDVEIRSGALHSIGTVHVSDLYNNQLHVAADGGFAFDLYEDPAGDLNSKLMVDGDIILEDGASVSAYVADDQSVAGMIGKRYEVISADLIEGSLVENEQTMLDVEIEHNGTNITLFLPGVRKQDGASTPSGNSVAKATAQSAQLVMNDLSAHSGAMRSLVRGASAPSGPAGPEAETLMAGKWSLFVRQINDLGAQDSDGGLAGFDWQTSGMMVGAERLFSPNLIVGATAGGAWTDLDGKEGAGGGASEMAMASLYGNWFTDTWYAEAGFSYARAWNDTQRIASDGQYYSGDYESNLYGTWLEAGYTLAGNKFSLEPYFRTSYVSGNHDGYTDSGGSNPLTVNANGTDNLLTETGLRVSRDWEMKNGDQLAVELKAAWQCELLDSTVSANGSLLGVDQTFNSPSSDRNSLALGIKADWKMSDAVTVGLEYAPTIAGNWYNHSIAASLKVEF